MKNDVITLIAADMSQDDAGFPRETARKETPVMAEVKFSKRTEYYQSVHAGFKVQMEAKVNVDDYEAAVMDVKAAALETGGRRKIRPTLAVHDGTTYKIVRKWRKGTQLELSLQEVE